LLHLKANEFAQQAEWIQTTFDDILKQATAGDVRQLAFQQIWLMILCSAVEAEA
jgi:hypothetical protein